MRVRSPSERQQGRHHHRGRDGPPVGRQTWTVNYAVAKDGAKAYKAKLEDAGFKAAGSYTGTGATSGTSFYMLKSAKYDVDVTSSTDKNQYALLIAVTTNKASSLTTTTDSSSSGDSGSSDGSGM